MTNKHSFNKFTKDKRSIKRWFSKLVAWHHYLLTARDPEHSGFATIYHPWESGFDNSPRWDDALKRIHPHDLPSYQRSDIDQVTDEVERPTQTDYDRYIYLVEILKKYGYDDKAVYKSMPFKIKDVVFNSILYVANTALLELAKILGEDTREIAEWIKRQEEMFLQQFTPNREEGLFYDYDLMTRQFIQKRTVASLIPLYTGMIERDIIEKTVQWLEHSHFCSKGTCKYTVVPSTSLDSPSFAHITYWRGPIWINTNWMIYQGLHTYGFTVQAQRLRKAMLDLVRENGFYEYFDPHNGKGHGGENFSWTAALTIDLIYKYDITMKS
jgi:hypothetical protein